MGQQLKLVSVNIADLCAGNYNLLYLSYNCSTVEHWDAVVFKPKVDSPWMATAKPSTRDRNLHLLVGLPWVINGPRAITCWNWPGWEASGARVCESGFSCFPC